LADARHNMKSKSHSTAEAEQMLQRIDQEKQTVRNLIVSAIEDSWIGYANAMGFKLWEDLAPESRQIHTMKDLRLVLKLLTKDE
jgi:3-hydroxyisobutyrate dehydrogenase-like beta-hydroxyacid dehydrogenase